ncbi:MAG: DMT family transporter [Candidatus Puniceispirillales bacterium]
MISALFTAQLAKPKAMALVFFGSTVWGLLWMPLRWLDHVGVVGLWSTFAFMAMPVIPLVIWKGRVILNDRKHHLAYVLTGGFIGLGFALYCTGFLFGSVTKTTLLFYLTPVWSSLMGMALLGERGSLGRWLANAMGIGGCALIMGISGDEIRFDPSDWFGFLSGIAWAAGSVGLRRYPDADFIGATTMQYVLGTVMVVVALLYAGTPVPSTSAIITGVPIAIITTLVFLPSMLIIFRINQYISPGLVGLLMISEAVVAVISAWLLLGERMAPMQWVGAALVLGTAVMVALTDIGDDQSSSGG